ncbi:PREDICTED: serine protease easter-like [Nicrophorus vespilloides]|uniref:Serine protease easter-like n=1 Tax=Nicrophorus vespilloides TaxID=110193 RepID=A0ABM1MRZ9_NICVS|nr:PREDICTED: serine protease easter-like [Nicrophorus vespilloides]
MVDASPGEKSKKYCRDAHVLKSGRFRRVVGGEFAEQKEFPHMVAVRYDESEGMTFVCGGSLITNKYVLTSASCVTDFIPTYVKLGDVDLHEGIELKIRRTIKHPEYNRASNNIGLIELESSVEFNENVSPACLNVERDIDDGSFIAAGWGKTETGKTSKLKKITLEEYDGKDCAKRLRLPVNSDKEICAYGDKKDTCAGDSGGPLQRLNPDYVSTYDIFGITSYGPSPCGAQSIPSVYTRVSSYIGWIESIVFA